MQRPHPPSPPQLDQYGRLQPVASGAPMRAMEYQTTYEDPRPPTLLEKLRRQVERAMDEWRVLSVIILLVTICILLGDLDVNVHWKIMSEYEPAVTYPLLKSAFTEHPSFFSFYTLPTDASAIFLEIPTDLMKDGQESPQVVFSATYARGLWDDSNSLLLLHEAAESTDHVVFTFNRTSDGAGVDLIRKQHGVRTTSPDDQMAVDLGTLSSRITTLPVIVENKRYGNKSIVVDASELVKKGFWITDVTGVQDARVRLDLCRSYPRNFDITAEYLTLVEPNDSTSAVNELITFSVALLPDEPIVGRAADERVGYFYLSYSDLGDHRTNTNFTTYFKHEGDLVDTTVKLINRRRLKSGADMQPITYYIDPTVPSQWRPAFKNAVEAWQPAFEAAGFGPKAIRAVLPTDEDWPSDYQAGDLRYSSITWTIDLDSTFALGPSVVDPRSGEILKSDIIFTHGWVKHWIATIENLDVSKDPTTTGMNALDPARETAELRRLLGLSVDPHGHHDHGHSHDHEHEDGTSGPLRARRQKTKGLGNSLRHHRHGRCQEARAKFDLSPALARLALESKTEVPKEGGKQLLVTDDIIMAGIQDVIMHEVGHTLGLRHNFKASSAVSWEQTQDVDYTSRHGLSISVMDYLPLNVVSGRGDAQRVDYFSRVIGQYDMMAIEYGYSEAAGERSGMPHMLLSSIADQNLAFGTDEDDSSPLGPDPYVTVFDFSADPIKYYLDRLELVQELRPLLLDRSVWMGDEFTRYAAAETTLLRTVLTAGMGLTKFVGGYTVDRARRAAPGVAQQPPLSPLTATEQSRALTGILRILTDNGDIFPQPDALPFMLQKGGVCSGLYQFCLARSPIDLIKVVEDGRAAILEQLFAPARLERLRTADWILSSRERASLSVSELFGNTTMALWGRGLAVGQRVKDTRNWNLQLTWVDLLLSYASGSSAEMSREVTTLAAGQLFAIADSIDLVMTAPLGVGLEGDLFRTVLQRLRKGGFVKGTV